MKKMLLLISSLFIAISFADEFVEDGTTTIGGYGEMHLDMENGKREGYPDNNMDFHRFIFYIKHQFNSEWSLMSEIEIEHNMVGSYYEDCVLEWDPVSQTNVETCIEGGALGDNGKGAYVAMEQAHLNYWNGTWGFKGGVVLVPSGIINEYHEPPTFMSVERPAYHSKIIPTTWFDNGFQFYTNRGDFSLMFSMVGDLDGDDITTSGLKEARRKGQYSNFDSWTKTFQVGWTGMEGLKLGASVTMNDAPKSDGTSVGVTLTEINATYSKNNIYARLENGTISYTDNPSCDGASGYYLDLGYDVADLVGFGNNFYVWTRMSAYNTDDLGDDNEISLFGVTFKPTENISFKLETGEDSDNDVMRMGLGYMF